MLILHTVNRELKRLFKFFMYVVRHLWEHCLHILTSLITLKDEFEMNMRLLGAKSLKEVVPSMVDASHVNMHVSAVPEDYLYGGNCKTHP